ncbi:MAG: LysM peptidoglycan-binding domain-containing protein [Candidatus Gracilibacteria bacterium]|nr:LysM peptidoglycan-binding domain-containing protein [Candidatus Gracilibacteria bacterium]
MFNSLFSRNKENNNIEKKNHSAFSKKVSSTIKTIGMSVIGLLGLSQAATAEESNTEQTQAETVIQKVTNSESKKINTEEITIKKHVVQDGETIWSIARDNAEYKLGELISLNKGKFADLNNLQVGDEIIVEGTLSQSANLQVENGNYIAQVGDTFYGTYDSLSKQGSIDMSYSDFRNQNSHLDNIDNIISGDTIVVEATDLTENRKKMEILPNGDYIIKSQEGFYRIFRNLIEDGKINISYGDFYELNSHITDIDKIYPGEIIKTKAIDLNEGIQVINNIDNIKELDRIEEKEIEKIEEVQKPRVSKIQDYTNYGDKYNIPEPVVHISVQPAEEKIPEVKTVVSKIETQKGEDKNIKTISTAGIDDNVKTVIKTQEKPLENIDETKINKSHNVSVKKPMEEILEGIDETIVKKVEPRKIVQEPTVMQTPKKAVVSTKAEQVIEEIEKKLAGKKIIKINGKDHFQYTVKKGDNLTFIAQRFGTSVRNLGAINNIKQPYTVRLNQTIAIPREEYVKKMKQKRVAITKNISTKEDFIREIQAIKVYNPNMYTRIYDFVKNYNLEEYEKLKDQYGFSSTEFQKAIMQMFYKSDPTIRNHFITSLKHPEINMTEQIQKIIPKLTKFEGCGRNGREYIEVIYGSDVKDSGMDGKKFGEFLIKHEDFISVPFESFSELKNGGGILAYSNRSADGQILEHGSKNRKKYGHVELVVNDYENNQNYYSGKYSVNPGGSVNALIHESGIFTNEKGEKIVFYHKSLFDSNYKNQTVANYHTRDALAKKKIRQVTQDFKSVYTAMLRDKGNSYSEYVDQDDIRISNVNVNVEMNANPENQTTNFSPNRDVRNTSFQFDTGLVEDIIQQQEQEKKGKMNEIQGVFNEFFKNSQDKSIISMLNKFGNDPICVLETSLKSVDKKLTQSLDEFSICKAEKLSKLLSVTIDDLKKYDKDLLLQSIDLFKGSINNKESQTNKDQVYTMNTSDTYTSERKRHAA